MWLNLQTQRRERERERKISKEKGASYYQTNNLCESFARMPADLGPSLLFITERAFCSDQRSRQYFHTARSSKEGFMGAGKKFVCVRCGAVLDSHSFGLHLQVEGSKASIRWPFRVILSIRAMSDLAGKGERERGKLCIISWLSLDLLGLSKATEWFLRFGYAGVEVRDLPWK